MPSINLFKETRVSSIGSKNPFTPLVVRLSKYRDESQLFVGTQSQQIQKYSTDSYESSVATADGSRSGSSDPETKYYSNSIATAGSIFHCTGKENLNYPRSITWRILNNSTVVLLEPTDLNFSCNNHFRPIRLVSPVPIISSCFVISQDEVSNKLIIDFVAQNWTFYTLSIPLNEFIDPSSEIYDKNSMSDAGTTLTRENSSNWERVDSSPPFDLHRPFMLHSVSPNLLVASLRNGALMKISRMTPLSEVVWENFPESTQSFSFSRFLWGKSDKVSSTSDVSVRTNISFLNIPETDYLVTISINCCLRIWKLNSMKLVFHSVLSYPDGKATDNTQENSPMLDAKPANLLSYLPPNNSRSGPILATFLPFDKGLFQFWNFKEEKLYTGDSPLSSQQIPSTSQENDGPLVHLGPEFDIIPKTPNSYSIWSVGSFYITDNTAANGSNESVLTFLWKSNTMSVVYSTPLNYTGSQEERIWFEAASLSETDVKRVKCPPSFSYYDSDRYSKWIFGPEGYCQSTLEAALDIYQIHYGQRLKSITDESYDEIAADSSMVALQEKICRVVGANVSTNTREQSSTEAYETYNLTIAQQWSRFDSVCTELERGGNEAFSMSWDSVTGTFWVVKASFTTLIRRLTPVEILYYNESLFLSSNSLEIPASITNELPQIPSSDISGVFGLLHNISAFRNSLTMPEYASFISKFVTLYYEREGYTASDSINSINSELISPDSAGKIRALSSFLVKDDSFYKLLDVIYESIVLASTKKPVYDRTQPETYTLSIGGATLISTVLCEIVDMSRLVVLDVLISLVALKSAITPTEVHYTSFTKYINLLKSLDAFSRMLYIPPIDEFAQTIGSSKLKALEYPGVTQSQESKLNYLSFFTKTLLKETKTSVILNNVSLTDLYIPKIWTNETLTSDDLAVPHVIAKLLVSSSQYYDTSLQLYTDFPTVSSEKHFSSFVAAHVCLLLDEKWKALNLFISAAEELSQNRLSKKRFVILKTLSAALKDSGVSSRLYSNESFGSGYSRYYIDVAKTCDAWGHPVIALKLAKLARQNLSSSSSPAYNGNGTLSTEDVGMDGNEDVEMNNGRGGNSVAELTEQVETELFNYAIKNCSLDDAYSCLAELKTFYKLNSSENISRAKGRAITNGNGASAEYLKELRDAEIREKLTPFVEKLATLATVNRLLPQFVQYPFTDLERLVESFFFTKARDTLLNVVEKLNKLYKRKNHDGDEDGNVSMSDEVDDQNQPTEENDLTAAYIKKDAFSYYHALHSWSFERGNYRQAAVALLLKIQHLRALNLILAKLDEKEDEGKLLSSSTTATTKKQEQLQLQKLQKESLVEKEGKKKKKTKLAFLDEILESYLFLIPLISRLPKKEDQWIVCEVLDEDLITKRSDDEDIETTTTKNVTAAFPLILNRHKTPVVITSSLKQGLYTLDQLKSQYKKFVEMK